MKILILLEDNNNRRYSVFKGLTKRSLAFFSFFIPLKIYQNPKLGCSVTVFEVNDVHYTSKRSDIKIMDRLNVPTKMNQNYGRSFLLAS